ncbi:MAG: YggT family protein [Firmicutes bacterium]|nr:YggT family protein [Bacillota bacterium]
MALVVIQTVNLFFSVLYFAIIIRALLSWFPSSSRWYWDLVRVLDAITEPIVAPIRSRLPMPMAAGIDISPIIALFLLRVVQSLVVSLLYRIL